MLSFITNYDIGVVEYLSTEISTSKQKKFSLVTFVDTPGLVDGDMKYPFDVEQAIFWLGNYSLTINISLFFFANQSLQATCVFFDIVFLNHVLSICRKYS